jgi:hypothetical protein
MAKARPPLEEMTLRQLRKVASEYNIFRYSRMRKSQLLEAILNIERQNQQSGSPAVTSETQEKMEATKFELGTSESSMSEDEDLAVVDEGLPDLPGGYGKSRIVMMPRDPEWSYVYWDVPNEHKEELRRQGGQQLLLRLYDVTQVNLDTQTPHSVKEYLIDELAREWYVPIPISDRDYLCEIGYRCGDGTWLMLARSEAVHTPPVYPSDWIEDHFIEVNWEEQLASLPEEEITLPEPNNAQQKRRRSAGYNEPIYEEIFEMSDPLEGERLAGSFYNSMPPSSSMNHYVFPSGVGHRSTSPGQTVNQGTNAWQEIAPELTLVGETQVMISGSTEPQATVIVGEQQVQTNADGTFSCQVPFHNGVIEYPMAAYSWDGKQIFSLQMKLTKHPNSAHHHEVTAETVLQWS